MDKEKKKPSGCLIGCLSVIFIILGFLVIMMIWTNVTGYKSSPEDQAKSDLSLLDNHYNEIKTDIGNLNVTGHGDFVNMMNDQIDYCRASIQDLNDDYGDESELINQCKQAWEKLISICIAYRDGVQNNDPATIATAQLFEQEYNDLIAQIQSQTK